MRSPRRWALLCTLALLSAAAGAEEEQTQEAFRARVEPVIRKFIFQRYYRFRASELTFRDLKEHVAEEFGMAYEDLQADELSLAIEDATDEITNTCDAGEVPLKECKHRIGYVETESEEKDEV